MKTLQITGGEVILDNDSYIRFEGTKWCLTNGYARRTYKGKTILMHHLILEPIPGLRTDHINGNKLDNRRENLRNVSQSENMFNSVIAKNNTSGRKGVRFASHAVNKKWNAIITINKKQINLGYFKTLEEAIVAREEAEKKTGFLHRQ